MKYIFKNSFFFIESTELEQIRPNDTTTFVIDFGIQKPYQHRYNEWKNWYGQNIYHEAYDKLADILCDLGFKVDIDDNWLRIFTTDEDTGFAKVKQVVSDNIDWLNDEFDV